MKTIKNIFLATMLLTGGLVGISSCTDYQDEIDALDKRVYRLEHLVDSINKNLDALQMFVNAAADGWIIKGMAELPEGNGYIVNFIKLDPKTGKESDKAEDKKTITVRNGSDAQAPDIRMQLDPTDGNYYWTINGGWLKGPDGEKIRVNGKDGKDGKDGTSTAPQLAIDDQGYWIMKTSDDGDWFRILDENGKPIKAEAKDGEKGPKGDNADTIISNIRIEVSASGERYIVFTIEGAGGHGEDVDVRVLIMD